VNFDIYLKQQRSHIEQVLLNFLPSIDLEPKRLHQSIHYSVLNGGKRIRPLLVYATGEIFSLTQTFLDQAACAVEFIHCYSLIHDDLPAMDNDDLRRGKPTCHIAFDEATAILAGDTLQSLAFAILANQSQTSAITSLAMTQTLALASKQMAEGQALDLQAAEQTLTITQLEKLHSLKTGALIHASIKLGALAANCTAKELNDLEQFAHHLGLAFQIQDDILDIESSTEVLGKRQGADIALQKITYPALVGMTAAKQKVQQLHQDALKNLEKFDSKANSLRDLANYLTQRQY
jgi:geranylgeranyl pyrophosphate synthase